MQRQDEDRRTRGALQVSPAEDARDHGDLAGVPDCVLDDAFEHGFVGVAAAGNLFAQIFEGKIAKAGFEEIAALVPAGDEIVPGNRWFGPFFFGLPSRERSDVGSVAHSLIPQEQMLKQLRNGVRSGEGWRRGELRRSLRQEFGERGAVPGVFDRGSAVGIGDLLGASHGWSSLHVQRVQAGRKCGGGRSPLQKAGATRFGYSVGAF